MHLNSRFKRISGYDSLSYECYVSSSTKVQLNLDNPTCFSGPNFSRIILTHIYGFAARRFFPQIMRRNCSANWICKSLLSTNLNMFCAQSTITIIHCILLSFDWFRFAVLLSEISSGSWPLIFMFSIIWTSALHYLDHSAQSPRVRIIEVWL